MAVILRWGCSPVLLISIKVSRERCAKLGTSMRTFLTLLAVLTLQVQGGQDSEGWFNDIEIMVE